MTLLRFEHVSKSFPGVRALDDVSLDARAGSVHALLGENGAGKSTLLKVLSGVYQPDTGGLLIDDRITTFARPSDAINSGVAVIYQELNLVPELSVAENIYLGHLPARAGVVDRRSLHARATELLRTLDESIDPGTRVAKLPLAQRQMVEIAKALSRDARVLAFDEPTSSLSARETDRLFRVIAGLKSRGCAVLYVSHRLEEVFRVCDCATVLRDGKLVQTFQSLGGVGHDAIIRSMVGRDIGDVYAYSPRSPGAELLKIHRLEGLGLSEPASLTVRAGEIVGVFGLVGAGRSELLRLAFGAERATGGSVHVDGSAIALRSPMDAIRAGLLLCTEDRKKDGIVPILSVQENINLIARRHGAVGGVIIRDSWERRNACEQIRALGVRTPSPAQAIRNLSGGNQQKAILARLLSEQVRVLMLDEPTRGIDVGAKSEIYAIIRALAERGVGILLVSSELPEVLGVSDRILVMRLGAIVGEFDRSNATQEALLRLALPPSS
ncbi:MAG: L-arabinose ABC transporter ATP-binding protein AraG [Phycisphaerales bacterium]|nr:L-arabinose ABC transporter ATP-binding protein AraG [Phycisphaerales bacterium]